MDGQDHPPEEIEESKDSGATGVPEERNTNPAQPATAYQLQEVEREMTGFERATLRWARVAVLMSGLAALFVCLQWHEMRKGGVDTHDLAVAAGKQADRMKDFADRMKDQSDRTKDLADRMKDQADRTKTIADQAVIQAGAAHQLAKNAVDTLYNTQNAFRDEQRAWVGVQGTADSGGFTETETWKVKVIFFNSGRTPARNVQTSGMYTTSPVAISGPSLEQINQLIFQPGQSIAPQAFYRHYLGFDGVGEPFTLTQRTGAQTLKSQYALIKNKQLFLYYFGKLKYEDTSGRQHETQFCLYLANPDTKDTGICDTFNDLN